MGSSEDAQRSGESLWCTAGVFSSSATKIFVGRLDAHDIEYELTRNEGRCRVSVRRRDLDEALLLVPSVARIQKAHRRMGIQSGIAWRLMLSIPLGAFVGSAARYFGHVNWDHTPVIGAIAMAMFVEAAWRGVAEMRQMMVRLTCSD